MGKVTVDQTMAGFILRYKASTSTPSENLGHVDAVLPGGAPFGFYASGRDGLLRSIVSTEGVVMDYPLLSARRPEYVDMKSARAKPCRSVLAVFDVSPAAARSLWSFWGYLRSRAPVYRAAGSNCASYIAEALDEAGILKGGVDGIDTPDHLLDTVLRSKLKVFLLEGFVSFTPRPKGEFLVELET
ncbi:hypothetical protein [Roseococcus sp.]|uniref:hypothetical protein n=1 Tax=Roseococcus sp. TaxID=2109646 RepID=UPI003BACE197